MPTNSKQTLAKYHILKNFNGEGIQKLHEDSSTNRMK